MSKNEREAMALEQTIAVCGLLNAVSLAVTLTAVLTAIVRLVTL